MEEHYRVLAQTLVGYSVEVKKGDNLLIDSGGIPDEFVIALIRETRRRGAKPFVNVRHEKITRELLREGTETQFSVQNAVDLFQMKRMDAYLALRGSDNVFETSDVPSSLMSLASRVMKPALDYRVDKTRWCILRWPTPSMAQQARMSTEAFADFFFRVCTLDYSRMAPGMAALKKLMEKTDRVHIEGPGTDLRFSIRGIGAVPCGGKRNIPDGEVFTAPVRDSVEGVITYNAPTIYRGISFDQIRLVFSKGRIVEATSNHTEALNQILDTDPGARYIGEFALGFNPHIAQPMGDILFDEKIGGSFHFTPGQAYGIADNKNRSSVHWDMVCIQRPDFGGGTIKFDGKVIRKDGIFVPASLQKLNPEYLLG